MNEIVDEIIQAEKRVEKLLTEAREKASEITQKAEKEAARVIEQARQKAQERVTRSVEDARDLARQTREKKLSAADSQTEEIFHRKKELIDEIVDTIVQLVISTNYAGKGS
jgi:vacuolar-type H+-ATPase subunit H